MTDGAPRASVAHQEGAVARLAIFCAPADREHVVELGGELLQGVGGLLLCAEGVPLSGKEAVRIFERTLGLTVDANSHEQLQPNKLHSNPVRTDFALVFARDELRLCKFAKQGGFEGRGAFDTNSVSLAVADLARRVGARTELQRACLTGLSAPRVLDAFAGWGMDAFALVSEGATVHCVERQPALCALLCDTKRRVPAYMSECLHVRCGDALGALHRAERDYYDVIYLDPMFPPRKKGALPNKRLQFLAELCDGQAPDLTDLAELIDLACSKAGKQVVLKRRKRDPLLAAPAPVRQVVGASVRYDIFAGGAHSK